MPLRKWRGNTSRENRLEELGRVDAEKAKTSKGKKNLRQEKRRIVKELSEGRKGYRIGGEVRKKVDPEDLRRPGRPGWKPRTGPWGGREGDRKPPRRGMGPTARPVPRSLRDKLKDLYKKRVGKQSPGRPGGKGPKPDKRWNKGDKFMTPLRKMVRSGRPKIARKGWK